MILLVETKTRDEIRIVKEQEKQYKFVGSLILKSKHSIFEYNEQTGKIIISEIKCDVALGIDKKVHKKASVVFKKDCIYVAALNSKNAIRKLEKLSIYLKPTQNENTA